MEEMIIYSNVESLEAYDCCMIWIKYMEMFNIYRIFYIWMNNYVSGLCSCIYLTGLNEMSRVSAIFNFDFSMFTAFFQFKCNILI